MVTDELFHSLGQLGFAVLDDMSLVQDDVIPLVFPEEVDVITHNVIGSHHQVVQLYGILQSVNGSVNVM